jgi:hypothetical protein
LVDFTTVLKEYTTSIFNTEGYAKAALLCAGFLFSYLLNLKAEVEHSSKTVANFYKTVRFEVFMAVTMKNGVFWDVTPCGFCKN